ncbi:MAG: SRPBCC family protein [Solirubrobacteraceae bacterium]
MAVEATGVVEREVRIDARPETVFGFLTDPALLLRWQGLEVDLEPRPGGIYRVVVNSRSTVRGQFVEVDPPSRVVFTWGFEETDGLVPPGSSTVEVTLRPDGGGTLLRLVHRDLPEPARERHGMGWDHFLERLRRAAAGDDPGPDPWAR